MENNNKTIKLIDIKPDDVTDYKETSLLFVFPYCSNKCNNCQNVNLQTANKKEYDIDFITDLFKKLHTHSAIVCAGLEPFDSFTELKTLLFNIYSSGRYKKQPISFVIYTGYVKEEIIDQIDKLKEILFLFGNLEDKLIIKFGRYDENKKTSWFSHILGVQLATTNQYVIKYTKKNEKLLEQQTEYYC